MNIPGSILTMLAGVALTLISIWYGQNSDLLPVQASEEAVLIDGLFNFMLTIGTGLFLLVMGVIVATAIKFRRDEDDETDGPPVHGNIPLEILWTAIPAVIVLGLSVYSFEVYNSIGGLNPMDHSMAHSNSTHQVAKSMPGTAIAATLTETAAETNEATDQNRNQVMSDQANQDPATAAVREDVPQKQDAPALGTVSPRIGATPDKQGQAPEMVVNVSGMQYAWIFTYPDSGVVSAELHVPVGREILLDMTAVDVLHAFWVPQYRLKQDVIPGRQTELRFTPSVAGEYPVICAELCGPYHGAMNTKVIAETQPEYEAWIQEQVANVPELNATIALNPADQSPATFLAPFVDQMGISADVVQQLHSSDHHHAG